jgi:hypothetical protein
MTSPQEIFPAVEVVGAFLKMDGNTWYEYWEKQWRTMADVGN